MQTIFTVLLALAGPPEFEFERPALTVPARDAPSDDVLAAAASRAAISPVRALPPEAFDPETPPPKLVVVPRRTLPPAAELAESLASRLPVSPARGLPPHEHVLAYLRGAFKPDSVAFYREHDIEWNRSSMDRRSLPEFFAAVQCLDGGWGTDSGRPTAHLPIRVVTTRAGGALDFVRNHPAQRLHVVINDLEDGIRPEWLRIVNSERVASVSIAIGRREDAERLRDYLRNFTTAPILLRVMGIQPDGTQSDAWAKSFGEAIRDWDGFELYEMQRFATVLRFEREKLAQTVGLPVDKPLVVGGIIGTDSRYEKSEPRIAKLWEVRGPQLVRHLREQGYAGFWTDGFSDMESAIKDRALAELLERREP